VYACTKLYDNIILFCRLLFPDNPQSADVMLQSSGVDPSLRAQQLQLEHIEKLCMAYEEVIKTLPSQQTHTSQHFINE